MVSGQKCLYAACTTLLLDFVMTDSTNSCGNTKPHSIFLIMNSCKNTCNVNKSKHEEKYTIERRTYCCNSLLSNNCGLASCHNRSIIEYKKRRVMKFEMFNNEHVCQIITNGRTIQIVNIIFNL